MESLLEQTDARFQTTDWSLLRAMRDGTRDAKDAAAERLVTAYWPPVYAWLRLQGKTREHAAELTQAFFADVVIRRALFQKADADRGRLRSLMLTALGNHVVDLSRRSRRSPREARQGTGDLGREDGMIADWSGASAGEAFERRWAIAILEQALSRCETHYKRSGRLDYWEAFSVRVLRPAITGSAAPPLRDVAGELGFANAAHVAVAIHSAKKLCRTMIQSVIAETVDSPDECDDELRHVFEMLG